MVAKTKSIHLQNKMYIKKQRERIITPVENYPYIFSLLNKYALASFSISALYVMPRLKQAWCYTTQQLPCPRTIIWFDFKANEITPYFFTSLCGRKATCKSIQN